MRVGRRIVLAAAVLPLGGYSFWAHAAEDAFLDRFKGRWIGSGQVRRNSETSPWQVRCAVNGDTAPDRISIQGDCRAALILSRRIGADLTYDGRTGLYRGVYTGARVGPARLSGRRSGDVMRLTIAWPKPVNGDMEAEMFIRNEGGGVLRITVMDNLSPGGPVQRASELVLKQH